MPELSVITTDEYSDTEHGVYISASTHPFNISLPNLSESPVISFVGAIGRLLTF